MTDSNTQPVQFLKAHLALNVRNVARSTEFYRKLLGLEPSKVRPGYAKFDVAQPPLNLTLNETPFTDRGALSHMGLQVATSADVLATRARRRARQRRAARRTQQLSPAHAEDRGTRRHDACRIFHDTCGRAVRPCRHSRAARGGRTARGRRGRTSGRFPPDA